MGGGVWWMMPRTTPLPKVVGLIARARGRVPAGVADARGGRPARRDDPVLGLRHGGDRLRDPDDHESQPGVCGVVVRAGDAQHVRLFWLQSAPFLAAATVIVYAGAIVVTFVFVIMLAQQSGATVVRPALAAAVSGDRGRVCVVGRAA